MLRWIGLGLIGIVASLYTNNILHISFNMPTTFDYTKVDQETVLTPTLAMLGDSITQQSWGLGGTGAALANLYQRKLDVLNRGLSGYNTAWAIPVAKSWLPRKDSGLPPTALLTIWFGANDAAINSPQNIPLPDFKANLTALINLVHSSSSPYHSPNTKIVLITPPPVDAPKRNAELASRDPPRVPDRDAENTRLYAEAVKEVGKAHGLPVVDTWTPINTLAEKEGGFDRFLSDGLHLTADGYAVVTAAITKTIASELPELHWDRLNQIYPHWADVINKGALGKEFELPEDQK